MTSFIQLMLTSVSGYGNLKGMNPKEKQMSSLNLLLVKKAEKGDLNEVKYLVEKGADIHAESEYALRMSARYGRLNVVKYLVEKGADINANSDNALEESALSGHLSIVKFLVEKGADIHAHNENALWYSVGWMHLDIAKYLIEKGANIPDDPAIKKICMKCSFEIKLSSIQKNDVIHSINAYISEWLWKPQSQMKLKMSYH